MLRKRKLTVRYGPLPALKDVSLEVREGEVVALIGPNRAGKTTLLLTISGIVETSEGRVFFRVSTMVKRSLLEKVEARFFFQPVDLGCQTANLGVQGFKLFLMGRFLGPGLALVRLKQAGKILQRLLFPAMQLVRMNTIFGGNLGDRFFFLQDFEYDLGFLFVGKSLFGVWFHCFADFFRPFGRKQDMAFFCPLYSAADPAHFLQHGGQLYLDEVEDVVCGFPKSRRSTQKMPAHLHIDCLQKLGREAPQAQSLTVTLSELANPFTKSPGAISRGHQSREAHCEEEDAGNWCEASEYLKPELFINPNQEQAYNTGFQKNRCAYCSNPEF